MTSCGERSGVRAMPLSLSPSRSKEVGEHAPSPNRSHKTAVRVTRFTYSLEFARTDPTIPTRGRNERITQSGSKQKRVISLYRPFFLVIPLGTGVQWNPVSDQVGGLFGNEILESCVDLD